MLQAATPAGSLSLATGHSRESVRRKLRAHIHAVSALSRLQRTARATPGEGGSATPASAPPGDSAAGGPSAAGEGVPVLGGAGSAQDRAAPRVGDAGVADAGEAGCGAMELPRTLRRQDGGGGSLLAGNRGSCAVPARDAGDEGVEHDAGSSSESEASSEDDEDVGEFDEAVEVELDDVDALLDGGSEQSSSEDESLAALTRALRGLECGAWAVEGGDARTGPALREARRLT